MSPEQQAIVKALLMQGGQMTPMQQYQNAADNSAGGMHPAQKRFMAGNPVAKEPFDPLEALSAPQAMEQSLLGGESRAPATSPRPQASPLGGLLSQMPSGFASVFSDLSPQEQQGILRMMKEGLSVDSAFTNALGPADGSPSRGTMPPPAAPGSRTGVQQPAMPSGYGSVFSDLSAQEQMAIARLMQQGAPVDQAFDAVLGREMNAITRGR